MSGYDIFAWIVLVILVICVVGVFCIAGWLPGHIAKSPKHLYADAVTVAGWITLIFGFALWLRSISLGMALAFNDVRHALTRLAATGRISGEHSFSGRIAMKAAFALFILVFALASPARAQTARWDDLANLPFPNSYPTKEAADKLRDELVFERAVQVYLWALPAVNLMAMREGSEKAFGAGYNVFPVWKERLNAKTIVTTPNSDVIYAMAYVDVGTDGPLVIEIPPEQQGILDDFWQRPVSGPTVDGKTYAGDVGLPGPDKGRGGKFLLLPPGYQGNVPDGYYSYRSRTNNVLVFWRAFFNDPNNLGPAVRLIEQTRIYPLGKRRRQSRCSSQMRRVSLSIWTTLGMARSTTCWRGSLTVKPPIRWTSIGVGCWLQSASSRVSRSILMHTRALFLIRPQRLVSK